MIRNCPYCKSQIDISDNYESGHYQCGYENCSKTFYFDRDKAALYKIEEEILKTSEILDEFDQALEDEIKTVRTQGGERTIVLRDGKFIEEMAGGRIYQFNTERKIPIADETPAQIEISKENYRASIARFSEFKLEVLIKDFYDEIIAFAFLKIDSTYVLKKLKEALSLLEEKDHNLGLSLKVFNFISSETSLCAPTFTLMDENRKFLDSDQSKAVEACLGSEVSFVHGPPGTGKTRTLVNLVNDLANSGKKVLVSCHTNIACDNVIDQFIRYEHEETVKKLLKSGGIVRIGTPVLQNPKIKALTINEIYENLSKELNKEKALLTDSINSLNKKNEELSECKLIFLEYKKLGERIENCKENISSKKWHIKQYIK